MAGWNSGIKLLLAAYKGPEVRITREKNSLSDFVNSEKISAHFEPLFVHEKFFDG